MKKIKFGFRNSFNPKVVETFEFEDDATEEEIEKEFKEWYFNELDIAGIEGSYEEVE